MEMMDLDRDKSIGNVLIESSIADVRETFERSDSLGSADVINADDCYENVTKEQKISVPGNGNIVNSVRKMNVGKNDKVSTDSVTNEQVDEKLRRAIDIVVGYSRVSNETKERLKSAVTDVHCKLMSEEEACQCYQLAISYFRTYYNMVEKLLNRANLVAKEHNRGIISAVEESGIETNVKDEGPEVSTQTSNDESNVTDDNQTKDEMRRRKVRRARKTLMRGVSAVDKKHLDKCIHDYCESSIRHSTKVNAIRKAVSMVLHEGCTGVDAARATNLTPRTVMKHVYIVKDSLNLPKSQKANQQTTSKNAENEIKEKNFPRKVTDNDREIAKMLINENFGCVEAEDFSGTALELESKVDKLLRAFSYNGNVKKIRETIIKIFMEQKSSEMYKVITELPITIVNSYVRLLKGFLWAENAMKNAKGMPTDTLLRGRRKLHNDGECDDIQNAELARSFESDGILSAKKKRKSMSRGVFIGKVDVLTLHAKNGVENEEQLMKSVISYLIGHQYRRSEMAQTNMQICLEHILLDGLSVSETLRIHDGPNEGILEIYNKRCRDAFIALTVDFPTFVIGLNSLNEGMAISRRFLNMPQTIFDKDSTDLDISDEMEEVRELLYELIKTNFSSGVMVEHLAKIYKESYETTGLGPLLPNNWLDHIRVAEEFEVVNRGPIVMVYTRQRDAASLIIESSSNSLNITKGLASPKSKETARIRLTDRELAQQMKSILSFEPIICPSTVSVIVMKCDDDSTDIYVQLASTKNNFELLRSAMDSYYEEQASGEPVTEPEVGGIYAIRESDGHWYRALLKVPEYFILLDNGRIMYAKNATTRRLRAEYALPRIYPIYAFIVTLDKKYDNAPSLCILRTACHTQLPLPLRFISAYTENCLVKYNVQSSIVWIEDRKEQEQNVIKVIPPQYPVSAGEVELVAMELNEMPKKRFAAHILAVFDANDISIRQCSFDPIPDYILSAVKRDSLAQSSPPPFSELIPGRFYAAKLHPDSNWDRVRLLGPSTIDADCFRVYAVDIGSFGIVRKSNIRHLRIPNGLRKILMAKCKIAGIKPKNGGQIWCREGQAAICNILTGAKHVEVEPVSDWELFEEPGCIVVPFATVNIFADGNNVGQMIIEQGYAQHI
ncbi:hypothetical protein ACO02O_06170 [Dirofilaria immitis]